MSKIYKISEVPIKQINKILNFNKIIDEKLKGVESQDFPTSYTISNSNGEVKGATVGENRKSITIIEGNTQTTASFSKTTDGWFMNDEIIIRAVKSQGIQMEINEKELKERSETQDKDNDENKKVSNKNKDNGINIG